MKERQTCDREEHRNDDKLDRRAHKIWETLGVKGRFRIYRRMTETDDSQEQNYTLT
jgi:hypothetical protein